MSEIQLPVEIVSLEDISPNPNLLIFGDSGVGKTVFSASDDKVLILNTEPQGTVSAKMLGLKADVWNIRSVADMDKVYNWALNLAEKGIKIPYNWFAVDSLTEYQDIDMREILSQGIEKKPNKDAFVPEWPDYLKNQKRIVRRVKEFNSLPVNMLWTALVTQHTDPEGNDFVFPAVHGKKYEVAQLVCAQMTSYGYFFVKDQFETKDGKKRKIGTNRYILWESTGTMRGKDRTTILAPWTKNLTLKEIREKIEGLNIQSEKTTKAS